MPVENPVLDELLARFVQNDPESDSEFRKLSKPIMRGLARRFGAGLPADLIDEVVSESFVLLLGGPGRAFDPQRGSARSFLFGIVQNAAQRVRAIYCPPGMRTRLHKEDLAEEGFQGYERVVAFDEEVHVPECLQTPTSRQMEARIDLEAMLRNTNVTLVAAMVAIVAHGEKVGAAAGRFGLSRFQFNRAFHAVQKRAAAARGRLKNVA